MKALLQIQVVEEVSRLLNTREAATELMNAVRESKCKHIEFDFSNVEFMSRSFADQFYKEKIIFMKNDNDIIIDITNANEEVVNMLRTVANTQNKVKRDYLTLPVFKFSDSEMLSNYLMTV
ncbi:MAG: hypothetical protein RQ875_08885 [Vicingaceae bacterium]|nr:hypothetical protein [Vicingaceae bacterium]